MTMGQNIRDGRKGARKKEIEKGRERGEEWQYYNEDSGGCGYDGLERVFYFYFYFNF